MMEIIVKTTKDSVEYSVNRIGGASNDELCRAVAHLKIIQDELLNSINFDFEIFDEGDK